MRISSLQPYNNLLQGITKQMDARSKANVNLSSGTRFQTPAQAGLDYKLSLDLRQMRTVESNALIAIKTAETRLSITQSRLMDIEKAMARAQVIATQQASATVNAAERTAASVEVQHLIDQVTNDANTTFNGQYIFSGTATDTAPWSVDLAASTATYQGSTTARTVQITETQSVISNELGNDPGFQNSFNALIRLYNGLKNNQVSEIQASLSDVNTARGQIVDLDARAGAKFAALQTIKTSHREMKYNLDQRINTHEAVDVPKLVTEMQLSDIALQASYRQVAAMSSLSLVNFLR